MCTLRPKRDKTIISFLESTWTSYAEVKKEICTFVIKIKKLNISTEKKKIQQSLDPDSSSLIGFSDPGSTTLLEQALTIS
jgi:hypothetical protein